jgi:hypothetical protein
MGNATIREFDTDSRTDRSRWRQNVEEKELASSAQLWRLNQIGLVDVRDEPGEPLERTAAKEILAEAAKRRLWNPARGERGQVRGGL